MLHLNLHPHKVLKVLFILTIVILPILSSQYTSSTSTVEVQIRVVDLDGNPIPKVYIFITDFKGEFFKDGITDSNGLLRVTIPSNALDKGLIAYARRGSIDIGNVALRPNKLEYTLIANAITLRVSVVDSVDGDPIDWCKVVVSWGDPAYGTLSETCYTGANGESALAVGIPLKSGEVKVKVEVYKFSKRVGYGEFTASKNVRDVVIKAQHLPDIKVKVVDRNGNPVGNVEVSLKTKLSETGFIEYTDSRGVVEYTGVPPGRYYLIAAFKGLRVGRVISVSSSDKVVTLRFTVEITTTKTETTTRTTTTTTTTTTTSTTAVKTTTKTNTTTTTILTTKPSTPTSNITTSTTRRLTTTIENVTTARTTTTTKRTTRTSKTATIVIGGYTTSTQKPVTKPSPRSRGTTVAPSPVKVKVYPQVRGVLRVLSGTMTVWEGEVEAKTTTTINLYPGTYRFEFLGGGTVTAEVTVLKGVSEQVVFLGGKPSPTPGLTLALAAILAVALFICVLLVILRYRRSST